MKKSVVVKICIFLSFLLLTSLLYGQNAPEIDWSQTYGDRRGRSVQQTMDGGYIITGQNAPGDSSDNVCLIKTNSTGDILWKKSYGDIERDQGKCVEQTSDGGYIVAGFKTLLNENAEDLWLLKMNSDGDTTWTKLFGEIGEDRATSVEQTSDGGYIITGNTNFYGSGGEDVWLIKTDSIGGTMWTKTFGGVLNDNGNCVKQTSDDGYVITGYTNRSDTNGGDLLLIKTDSEGDTMWTKIYGGMDDDEGEFLQITSDGGYIITGHTNASENQGGNVWLVKTDSAGDTIWTKSYGGFGEDEGVCVRETHDDGYIISGSTSSFGSGKDDLWLIKTDPNGDTLWTKIYGGIENDNGMSVQQTSDKGYIITGRTNSFGELGSSDIWLIKIAPDTLTTNISINNLSGITTFELSQNYPNPFNPSTKIEFTLPNSEFVELKVYNILGKEVSNLVSKKLNQGNHSYQFDGNNLASGIYYYQLVAGDFREVKKMILLR